MRSQGTVALMIAGYLCFIQLFCSFFPLELLRLLLILLHPSATGPPKKQCWCDGVWIRGMRLLSWQLTNLPLFWIHVIPTVRPSSYWIIQAQLQNNLVVAFVVAHLTDWMAYNTITTTNGVVDMLATRVVIVLFNFKIIIYL